MVIVISFLNFHIVVSAIGISAPGIQNNRFTLKIFKGILRMILCYFEIVVFEKDSEDFLAYLNVFHHLVKKYVINYIQLRNQIVAFFVCCICQ